MGKDFQNLKTYFVIQFKIFYENKNGKIWFVNIMYGKNKHYPYS